MSNKVESLPEFIDGNKALSPLARLLLVLSDLRETLPTEEMAEELDSIELNVITHGAPEKAESG